MGKEKEWNKDGPGKFIHMITPTAYATEKGSLAAVQNEAVDKDTGDCWAVLCRPASLVDAQPWDQRTWIQQQGHQQFIGQGILCVWSNRSWSDSPTVYSL